MLFVPRPGATLAIAKSRGVAIRTRLAAELIASEARGRVRVLTGETQKSIRVEATVEGARVIAGSGDWDTAARWLEFGTSRQPPYPFLRPAADAVIPGGRRE